MPGCLEKTGEKCKQNRTYVFLGEILSKFVKSRGDGFCVENTLISTQRLNFGKVKMIMEMIFMNFNQNDAFFFARFHKLAERHKSRLEASLLARRRRAESGCGRLEFFDV